MFTIELLTVEAAAAFSDDLGLHKGLPLGCSMALAQPYVQAMYQKERQRVGGCEKAL